jgi:4-hydroxy-tetrahydrodipicolinate synthase
LKKLIDFNIENGINYFVSLGTTGESATLTNDEKRAVWDFTVNCVNSRIPLIAGVGGNNTATVVNNLKSFSLQGFDAVLSVSPYYNKPSQEGIFQHFMSIGEASPLPVIIYNVPSRTGSNITAETTLRLANASSKFIGIKEASGNLVQCMHIAKEKPADFLLISGDDIITLPMMSFGAAGVISVVAQAFPKNFSCMIQQCLNGNYGEASAWQFKLIEAMELFFAEGSPAGVKACLHSLGICENVLRLPLVPVSESLYARLKSLPQ